MRFNFLKCYSLNSLGVEETSFERYDVWNIENNILETLI